MYRNFIKLLLIMATMYSSVAITNPLRRRIALIKGDVQKTVDGSDFQTNYDEYDYAYEDEYTYSSIFTCFEGSEDVSLSVMCDGYYDCSDGSDELPANCEEYGVDSHTKTTAPVLPVENERDTTSAAASIIPEMKEVEDDDFYYEDACTSEEFLCRSDPTICLPQSQVCDGIHDCPDQEDEDNCTAIEWKEQYLLDAEGTDPPPQIESPNAHSSNILDTGRPDSKESSTTISAPLKFLTAPQVSLPPAIFIPELDESPDKLNLESQYEYYDYLVLDSEGKVLHKNLDYEGALSASQRGELTADDNKYAKPTGGGLDVAPGTLKKGSTVRPDIPPSYVVENTKRKIGHHKRKVKRALGQLLQQIGELLKAESELEIDYSEGQKSSVELTVNTRIHEVKNDLYSRISRHRTSLTLNVGL